MNPNHIGTNFDDFLKEEGIMTDKQTLKVIKNPVKKAICILATKYWRWFQKTIGVNNDR